MISRRGLLAAGAGVPVLLATGARAASAAPGDSAYVMGYFTESPNGLGANYGLHLAVSTDGLNWAPLNQNEPVATPTAGTGGLRDPFILRKQDGTFVVLATDLTGTNFAQANQYIHVWDSADLRSFTGYRRLRLNDLNSHTWAPEAFYDPARGQYGITYSIYNGTRDVIFVNYTTDFRAVTSAQVYFDPGFNVLDASFHSFGGTNYLYYKRTSDNTIWGARSASLDPGSFNSGTYTGPFSNGATEGPFIVQSLTSDTWYLWADSYTPINGEFYVWRSTNIAASGWSVLSKADYTQPLNSKHATVATITAAEYDNLIAGWGAPNWIRLKSYNEPDRFVRHANNAARIDPYPFDPYADAQWRLVAGLADSTGVSFESVNYAGQYLRHSNSALVLNSNDGSALFRADATFYRTAGLADSAHASFQSYNVAGSYIRHSNYVLRIDPLSASSAAIDRQDATFRVVY